MFNSEPGAVPIGSLFCFSIQSNSVRLMTTFLSLVSLLLFITSAVLLIRDALGIQTSFETSLTSPHWAFACTRGDLTLDRFIYTEVKTPFNDGSGLHSVIRRHWTSCGLAFEQYRSWSTASSGQLIFATGNQSDISSLTVSTWWPLTLSVWSPAFWLVGYLRRGGRRRRGFTVLMQTAST
jgi:hypothetical protein